MTNGKNEKWVEVFSQGDVWEIEVRDGKLMAYSTTIDPSYYDESELVDNGISSVYERAKSMRLEFVRVDFYGNEVK